MNRPIAAIGNPPPPVLCVIGPSGAGKTTLLTRVIERLAGEGLRIGALKHDAHRFQMDREGKDTYRLHAAGACAVGIASATTRAVIIDTGRPTPLAELVAALPGDLDLVLVEGYKADGAAKLEVHLPGRPLLGDTGGAAGVLAVISDDPSLPAIDAAGRARPRFARDDIDGVCAFVRSFLRGEPSRGSRLAHVPAHRRSLMRFAKISLVLGFLTAFAARANAEQPGQQPGPYYAHANLAMNAYTYLGSTDTATSTSYMPDSRVVVYQQVGLGYFVSPEWRVQLTLQAGETISGGPATASHWTLGAAIPWAVYAKKGFFGGAGLQIAPRAYGKNELEMGLFTACGYGVKIGGGFSLALAVQAPVTFLVRTSVAITPAVSLGYRF